MPLAASLFGLLLGGSVAYLSVGKLLPGGLGGKQPAVEMAAADNLWLDNAVGYFKLAVSAGDGALVDVPATGDAREALQKISQSLPQEVRPARSQTLGSQFPRRPARRRRRPAGGAAGLYDRQQGDRAADLDHRVVERARHPPTLARRQDVNLLYWRHQGRAYALVGQTDIGYLWGIANDVAWQLDAI